MKYIINIKNVVVAAMLVFTTACTKTTPFDTVIKNANVLAEDANSFRKVNIGITNGNIVEITTKEIFANEIIDGNGSYVYPGFLDAHCHFWGYAQSLIEVNLTGTKSEAEIVSKIEKFKLQHPDLNIIYGRGWDQNDWENSAFPTHTLLSKSFPNTPIILKRIDGHAAWLNRAAMNLIQDIPTSIAGGKIIMENNKPTGVFIDRAMELLPPKKHSETSVVAALEQAEKNCFAVGLTGLTDAGLPMAILRKIDSLQQQGVLKMPIYAMVQNSPKDVNELFANGKWETNLLTVNSIKVYFDGALGSRGALLTEPYSDAHTHGIQITSAEELKNICMQAKKHGMQINVHAIGDSANRTVLRIFSEVLTPNNDARWRIEHAQIVIPEDSTYFKEYKILPSVQPTHATSDMYWAEQRIGKRIKRAYTYNDLMRWSNYKMPLGTDFPIEKIDPLKTVFAATVRKDSLGFPEDGFFAKQKISRTQALLGVTAWAAYGQFAENRIGTIAKGKEANFVFSSTNLLESTENELLNATIQRTILRGKTVFEAAN